MTHAALQDQTPAEVVLLPCPFCGSAAVTLWPPTCEKDSEYNPADRAFPIVRCGCGVEAPGENWDHKGSSAIAAWNRRASLKGEAEPVAWIEPYHIGALRRRRENKEPGYILVEVCDSETEDYCVPLYTTPPAPQAVGEADDGLIQQALSDVNDAANDFRHAGKYSMANALVQARVTLYRAIYKATPSPAPQGGGEAEIPHWALPSVENALNLLDHYGFMHTDLAAVRDWLKENT